MVMMPNSRPSLELLPTMRRLSQRLPAAHAVDLPPQLQLFSQSKSNNQLLLVEVDATLEDAQRLLLPHQEVETRLPRKPPRTPKNQLRRLLRRWRRKQIRRIKPKKPFRLLRKLRTRPSMLKIRKRQRMPPKKLRKLLRRLEREPRRLLRRSKSLIPLRRLLRKPRRRLRPLEKNQLKP